MLQFQKISMTFLQPFYAIFGGTYLAQLHNGWNIYKTGSQIYMVMVETILIEPLGQLELI